jgi:hypothetical protein
VIRRITFIVIDGEREALARRGEGVDGSPAARRSSARCGGGVVDDDGSPRTDGISWGSS